MNKEFITFEKFSEKLLAEKFAAIFSKNNIEYIIEDTSASFDPTFSNNNFDKEFRVKLQKQDFDYANELILMLTETELSEIPDNYYLLDFTNEELKDVIIKRDEWNNFDFLLAQKLLKERGQEISPEAINEIKLQRLRELSLPEKSQKSWIIAGYVFALLGGLLGIFIGWHLMTHKKTLPNGERIYNYSKQDRKSGNNIFLLAIVSLLIWSAIKFI